MKLATEVVADVVEHSSQEYICGSQHNETNESYSEHIAKAAINALLELDWPELIGRLDSKECEKRGKDMLRQMLTEEGQPPTEQER